MKVGTRAITFPDFFAPALEFALNTPYVPMDVVTRAGSAYVCRQPLIAGDDSYAPDGAQGGDFWTLLAAGRLDAVGAPQLADAIAGTALNPGAVSILEIEITDPPTQSQVQQVMDKLNELITALRRL